MRAALLLLALLAVSCTPAPPTYTGSARCAQCHEQEARAWQSSQHALAIQKPTDQTVLGDFHDGRFEDTKFYRKGSEFWVRTDGEDYRVGYVFGVEPLQQLLLERPGGRLQAFGIAWDTHQKRWFSLYPDQKLKPLDPLHWTGRDQNWNHQCADCHSTNLHKNYDPKTDSYHTDFSELSVGCEACHGPGSNHPGTIDLQPPPGRFSHPDPTPHHEDPDYTHRQTELCARCHSLRAQLRDGWTPGQPLMDAYVPTLLEEGEYYPDGQQQDEVYNYGSFLQSKMYQAGVACSDCHDPHTARLRAEGDALCLRCHQTPAHSHHQQVSCVDCHAPTRTYMQVDPRRDHSFRVPRPDLSVRYGTPNACNLCHTDRDASWAAAAARKWYPDLDQRPQFVETLVEGREGAPGSQARLAQLAADSSAPDIVRATALTLVDDPQTLTRALKDTSPMVRLAAVRRGGLAPELVQPLLTDPIRAVRMEAAVALADSKLPEAQQGLAEYLEAQLRNADRPEAHLNRGLLLQAQGRPQEAEQAYRKAIQLDPTFAPAYVNLADLMRASGRDDEAEPLLRQGLERCHPGQKADLLHALGLLQVRQKNLSQALPSLAEAWRLSPRNPRYGLVYALALDAAGQRPKAVKTLQQVLQRHPWHVDSLVTLVGWLPPDQAAPYAKRLKAR